MKKILAVLGSVLVLGSGQAWASLDQAVTTVAEGAVEFPMGLIKLVGGVVWVIGEVIALPFNAIF